MVSEPQDEFIAESVVSTRVHLARVEQARLDDMADAERLAADTMAFLHGALTEGLELLRTAMSKQGRSVRFGAWDSNLAVLTISDDSELPYFHTELLAQFKFGPSLSMPGAIRIVTVVMSDDDWSPLPGLCGLVEDLTPRKIYDALMVAWRARRN